MLIRSNTAKSILPQPHSSYEKHRDFMRQKTRSLFSKQTSRSSERKLSTALFGTTAQTNGFFKPQTQQGHYKPREMYLDVRPESSLRPFTQSSGRCHRAQSPLSVIRTRSKMLSSQQIPSASYEKPRKTKFLRRGSAVDKAIINNVLKSKFNQNVCRPTFSYCDHEQNKQLASIIAMQIPKGVRDVIGAEQMLRMTHIFTGTQLKNINLTRKTKITLSQVKAHLHPQEEEDNSTLKSIKRW